MESEEKVLLKGPPVVSKIQALDQYGNVIAQAANSKEYQF